MKYLRSTTSDCKDIVVRNSEFVARTQFLYENLEFKLKWIFQNMNNLPIVSPPTGSVVGRGWEGAGENLKFLKI